MTNYSSLGLNIFKYNQAGLLVFSLLIILVNYVHGSSLFFWLFLLGMLVIINLIWNLFSDVKWNKEYFVIEKFLRKRTVAANEFISVERLFSNVFVIRFTGSKFYYLGGFKSIFENASDITNKIIADTR
nr:hypothetical protein [Pedobacter panaciterrae]